MRPTPEHPAEPPAAEGVPTIQRILRIQTFGGLRAWLGDEPLALPPSRQSRALLAYLACASKPSHRAGLCELLWNNTPEPRAALRWCLSKLRPILDAGGAARLFSEDDNVWIPEESCEVDGKRMRELAADPGAHATGELEEAVMRCAGPFLSDLDVADAYRFESWKASEEKSLEEARGRIFGELLQRHRTSPEAAVRFGHLWAQQDPFNPQAHIAIIEALTALGRKREALAHYERSDQMLRRDGGASHPGLERARAAIGRLGGGPGNGAGTGREAPAPAVSAPAPAAAHGNLAGTLRETRGTPLAGRREEMARFAAELAAAPEKRNRLILLQGEPGIGKTRLLEAMEDRLEAAEWIPLRGRAFETERGRAYGPWIDAAWTLASARGIQADACPLLHPSGSPEGGLADPTVLFEAVRGWLERLSGRSPLAFLLDDLHWLDPSSVALLQYLLRHRSSPLGMVICGIRSVAAPRDEAVAAFLTLARREAWAETWDIGPLNAEDTASLLGMVGSPRDPGEVFAESAGHPLASLALAHEGPDREGRRPQRASLDAMLDERIRAAGEEGRGVLQWAALLGRGLSPALLESLTDLGLHPLLNALEKLEAQGLMRVEGGKAGLEYLFGHDLIRQRIHASLSPPRLLRMHAHVAQVLRRNPSLGRGWEEIAQHAERGERIDLAIEACLEAGNHCLQLHAHESAMDFAQRGLGLLERNPGQWAMLRQMILVVSSAGSCLGHFPAGMDERLVAIAKEAKAAGQGETMLMALSTLATLRFVQERPADLVEAAKAVSEFSGEGVEPAARAYHLADMAICLLVTEQEFPRAFQLIGEAQSICERNGLREGMTEAGLGMLAHRGGRLDEARARMQTSIELLAPKEMQAVEHYLLAGRCLVELEADAPMETLRSVVRLREIYEHVRGKADAHFADAFAAMALRMLGDPGAEPLFRSTLAALRSFNCKVMTAYLLLFWAERDFREGHHEEIDDFAREAIERCEPLKRSSEPTWARCLMGLLALRRDRRDEAEALWQATAPARGIPGAIPARVFHLVEELAMGLGHPL